ncbi:UTRA domain-containing protein [Nonomuraea aridisoli]|uniref:UbiC transcription regulator-associated domain-containing protein n=1 Tax=Nonomuraea aridisoli TaxID=2070368 RepID=A0A2W2EMU9_9ACTN|nr:hypothetical protein C1J01_42815 [Nonomuraea aridisoli]
MRRAPTAAGPATACVAKGRLIAFPEVGPYAGLGVTHPMAAVGIQVDAWDEEVWARPAAREEAQLLRIGSDSIVMVVERAYFAGEQAVEVADMVVPADSTKVIYNGPVGDGGRADHGFHRRLWVAPPPGSVWRSACHCFIGHRVHPPQSGDFRVSARKRRRRPGITTATMVGPSLPEGAFAPLAPEPSR